VTKRVWVEAELFMDHSSKYPMVRILRSNGSPAYACEEKMLKPVLDPDEVKKEIEDGQDQHWRHNAADAFNEVIKSDDAFVALNVLMERTMGWTTTDFYSFKKLDREPF
jgi:hypothetical protein